MGTNIYRHILLAITCLHFTVNANAAYFCKQCTVIEDQGQYDEHNEWFQSNLKIGEQLVEDLLLEEDSGKELVANQKDINSTIQTETDAFLNSFSAMLKEHAIAMNVYKNTLEFSPNSQSSFACCSVAKGEGITKGSFARKGVYQQLYDSVNDYNRTEEKYKTTSEGIEYLYDPETGKEPADALTYMGFNDNISPEDSKKIVEAVITVTNPLPYPVLTNEKLLENPSGEKYALLKKIKNTQIGFAQQAVIETVSNKTGVYNMSDWASQMNKSAGGSGSHPFIENSTLSADGVLAIESESRYANPNWNIDLHRKTLTGLIREMAAMKVIDLENGRRQLETAQKEVYLTAVLLAQKTNNTYKPKANKAIKKAVQTLSEE